MAKIKLCTGDCDRCGEQIVWRAAESGSLSYTCQHCDFRGYAPAHTDAARMIEATLTPEKTAPAEVKPSPPESPPMPAKPAAKKTGSIWDDLVKPKEAVQ